MAGKDELPVSLPDPPPTAPARRETAIEMAMARFDGAERPSSALERPRPTTLRPYLVSAMALSLLALIVAPVAWMNRLPTHAPAPKMAHQAGKPPIAADADAPSAAIPAFPVEVRQEPPADAPAAAPPPAETASEPAPPPPPQEKAAGLAQAYQAMPAPPMAAPAAPPAPAAAPAPATKADRRARMAESENSDDIVVTSVRADPMLLRGRGDWNACTVEDPERNLSLCRRQINPMAKGRKGAVSAHMADGLDHAWKGDWSGAITAFDQAIALAPKSSDPYLNRGLAYQAQGDEARALADFDRAIRYAPDAARAYYHRSLLQRQRGEARKAEADRAHASRIDERYEP